MKEYEKTKFKACAPSDTVARLKEILRKNGIETEETWIESGIGNICSVRICVKGTPIGQNGKGTSRQYCLASGYAEFMERLQTGYLFPERSRAPFDRTWMDRAELEKSGAGLLEKTLIQIQSTLAAAQPGQPAKSLSAILEDWTFDARDGKVAVIPFRNRKDHQMTWLPETILRTYYFTNGSCAGNTEEEALIQGMSEVMERYATGTIMTRRLTPPRIPDEAFSGIAVLKDAIDTIRGMDRYDLRIMDASCGMGLPVAAAILTDQKTAKTVLRFGAHPRFEIALERCLTEILQGRHIDRLETSPVYDFARDENSTGTLNRFNFMKAAFGQFPAEIFGKEPSWEYRPFEEAPEDIHGQLSFLEALYDKLGWDVYIRDCSFLGFPTFQLVVPGVSMVFDFGEERLKEKRMLFEFRTNLGKEDAWSYENLRLARRLAVLKRGFLVENTFSFLAGLPVYPKLLGVELDASLLAGLTSLALYDRKRAAGFFEPYCFYPDGTMTGIYPLAQLLKGKMSEEVCSAMECICGKEQTEAAKDVICHPERYLPIVRPQTESQAD